MTLYTWKSASGDWNDASDWSPAGGPPTALDAARINGSATDTITADTADVADSLTLSDPNATLNDDGPKGSLTIGGTLTVSNGTLIVDPIYLGGVLAVGALNLSGGALALYGGAQLDLNGTLSQTGGTLTLVACTISGGTIDSTAGTLVFGGATLSGVTFDGPLNLTALSAWVQLANGTTVVGSSGSGSGTINITGVGSALLFDDTQTVRNTTINLNNGGGLSENDTAGAGDQVLTLASSVSVDVKGNADIESSDHSGDGIVNEGAIDITGSTDTRFVIKPTTFTNSGTIDVKGTFNTLLIKPATFTNTGTIDLTNLDFAGIEPTTFRTTASSVITIGASSSVTIDPTNAWTNLGSITLASGADLVLYGAMSAASLGSVTNSGGTINIAGTWNNYGQTLNGSAPFGALALVGGTISGGTITSAGVSFTTLGGTLSGVTFDGPLNLTSTYGPQSVDLANGTTVVGSSGSGPGTINVTGSFLYFDNTQTVSNDTINLSGSGSSEFYEIDTTGADDQVLTLASSVTVDVVGDGYMGSSNSSGDGILNDGAIDITANGGFFVIDPNAFTNNGTIDVANGERVNIQPTTFTTTASSDIAIGANSSLSIEPTNSWTNLGSIMLAGDASLTSSSVINHGVLEGTGGTGTSMIESKVTNAGSIGASSGTLEVKGAVTGKGTDTIASAATLEFGAGVSSAKTLGDQDIGFNGAGTLHLLKPASFYGEISDFAAGDTVELLGSWHFSGISHAGDVTTLTLGKGATRHACEFAGDYTRSDFSITPGPTTKIGFA